MLSGLVGNKRGEKAHDFLTLIARTINFFKLGIKVALSRPIMYCTL